MALFSGVSKARKLFLSCSILFSLFGTQATSLEISNCKSLRAARLENSAACSEAGWMAASRPFKKKPHNETGEDERDGKEGLGEVAAAKEISIASGFLKKEEKRQ